VFGSNSTVPSVDIKNDGEENTPIYPWPQLIVENTKNDGGEKYELKYPGDPVLSGKINAFIPEIWPEVEFVEEFVKGYAQRESTPNPYVSNQNENKDIHFMREDSSEDVNSGFFIIKNNDNITNIINFFIEVLQTMMNPVYERIEF
jgi:hypothetical protein